MLGGFVIPTRNMPSLGQPNLMEIDQLHPLDMPQNTSNSDIPRISGYEFDNATKSESGNQEGAFKEDQDLRPQKKKCYYRHTRQQIEKLECFFKECPHPNDMQRRELGRVLGLKPVQVKFWFQNKHTQLKVQHERNESMQLKTENERLQVENKMLSAALNNVLCSNCGGPFAIGEMSFDEQDLRIENTRLREESDRMSTILSNTRKPMVNYPFPPPSSALPLPPQLRIEGGSSGNPRGSGWDKLIILELAVAAMKELIPMVQMSDPLWLTTMDGITTVLNQNLYNRCFPRSVGPKLVGLKREASRESAIVFIDHVKLVEILMDVNQWSTIFSSIVSRAVTMEVLSTGVAESYNGALQVMIAEFQVPSPIVPTRGSHFLRFCKNLNDGTWAIVDLSLDELHPNASMLCIRKPSGCIIKEMGNGFSKVIWVEHVEVDDRGVHNLYKQLFSSGHAFSAKHWITTLGRQCERLASVVAPNIPTVNVGVCLVTGQGGRKNMLKLAERMVISFYAGVSACSAHPWKTLPGSNDTRVMIRKSVGNSGSPTGLILIVATSFWVPHSPKRVFEFLCNNNSRSQWDILSKGGVVQEMAHIANGQNTRNCVSALRVNSANPEHRNMSILQESFTDSTGSCIIYAPVGVMAMNGLLNGIVDPNTLAILPSGFAILPDGITSHGSSIGGSLMTLAHQLLIHSSPKAKVSISTVAHVNNLVTFTVNNLKTVLSRRLA